MEPQAQPIFLLPSLSVKWGSYDKADPEVEDKIVGTILAARGAGGGEPIITRRIALEKAREVFPIENVDALEKELDEEREAKREADEEARLNEASALHEMANGEKPSAARGGGRGNKAPAPGGGSSGGSPASKTP
jgi:hypothetical protein